MASEDDRGRGAAADLANTDAANGLPTGRFAFRLCGHEGAFQSLASMLAIIYAESALLSSDWARLAGKQRATIRAAA